MGLLQEFVAMGGPNQLMALLGTVEVGAACWLFPKPVFFSFLYGEEFHESVGWPVLHCANLAVFGESVHEDQLGCAFHSGVYCVCCRSTTQGRNGVCVWSSKASCGTESVHCFFNFERLGQTFSRTGVDLLGDVIQDVCVGISRPCMRSRSELIVRSGLLRTTEGVCICR